MTIKTFLHIRRMAKNIKLLLWVIALVIVVADMAIIFAR